MNLNNGMDPEDLSIEWMTKYICCDLYVGDGIVSTKCNLPQEQKSDVQNNDYSNYHTCTNFCQQKILSILPLAVIGKHFIVLIFILC